MRRHNKKPTGISEVIASLAKTTPLGEALKQAEVWEKWPEIVGEKTAEHTKPHRVKDGTLTIVADSPVWMHRLSYRKWAVIRKINRLARKELVSDVFFQLLGDEDEIDTAK